MNRALDIVTAALGLAVTSPLLAVSAIAIKLEDGGPVLFRQTRVGRDGKDFELLKLRTMVVDAERKGAGYAIAAGDSRITKAGRILRKTSVDELPQLWNVVRGEMSLVGPRPDQADQLALYAEGEHLKLAVRPGLTGAAQVLGRNARSWRDRKRLDRWYVRRWSHALDARLLCLTIGVLVRPQGIETHAELPPSHHPT